MSQPLYHLQEVTKKYDERQVCRVKDLEIHGGSITVITGPNGAGKSTLLKMLGFLEPPTTGTISFEGRHWSNGLDLPISIRRRVTLVLQTPALFHGSVEKNVAYGLQVRGERDYQRRVQEVLDAVGLAHLEKAKASTLSGGEAQRVAFARALAFNPDVLLLDEPTANLDPSGVSLVEKLIVGAARDMGTTVVLVTQNLFQAERLADQMMLVLDGELIEVGTSHKMFNNPDDSRTQAFLKGEMVY